MDNTQVVLFIRRQVLPTKANEKEVGCMRTFIDFYIFVYILLVDFL